MRVREQRSTKETSVEVILELTEDRGKNSPEINTGHRLLDHHLMAFARHGGFHLKITAKDDATEDSHHLFEDVGITLGLAINKAVNQRRIARFGWCLIPMDEVLVRCAVDTVKRPFFSSNMRADLFKHLLRSLAFSGNFCLHLDVLKSGYPHHEIEACFKALGIALKQALTPIEGEFPTTK